MPACLAYNTVAEGSATMFYEEIESLINEGICPRSTQSLEDYIMGSPIYKVLLLAKPT